MHTRYMRLLRPVWLAGVLLLALVLGGCDDDYDYVRYDRGYYPVRGYRYHDDYDRDGYRKDYGHRYDDAPVVIIDTPRRHGCSVCGRRACDGHHDRYDRRRRRDWQADRTYYRRPSKHRPPRRPPPGESWDDGEWEWDDGRWEWDD